MRCQPLSLSGGCGRLPASPLYPLRLHTMFLIFLHFSALMLAAAVGPIFTVLFKKKADFDVAQNIEV